MPILNWKELQQRNNQRQAGITEDVPDAEWLQGWDSTAPDAQEQYAKRFHDTFLRNKSADETVADMATAYREYRDAPSPYTDEDAARMGYGESRYDTRIPFDQWVKNPTDYRANSQTVVNKLLSGLGKMGVYAGATFVDNIGGTLNGVFDVVKDAVNGDGFTPVQSFINNPVSKAMRRAQEWSDEVMPNYRTEEETMDADHWWRHLNANFWGDTFLKNIGFTLGAAGAGKIFSVATQGAQMHRLKRLYGDAVYDAYKAAVAASAGDAAAQGAFREMLQGTPMDAKTMYDTFSKLNRSYNRMQWNGILAGSIGGAVGESRMEAMFNAKEFRDEMIPKAEARYEQAKLDLQEELLNNERYLMDEPVYDGYGNQVGTRPILNPEGEAYYRERLKGLQASYQKELGLIDDEAASLANWTFGLNMPILTGGNIVMFGRNFAGGFRSQARARVRGNMTQGYRPKGSPWNQAVRGVATAVSEGTEELAQKVVSEGTKNKARRDMATYYNGKYDKQALKDTSQWLMSVLNSVSDVIADPQSWEEFTVGFLTGGGTSLINAVARKDQRRELEQSKEYAESLNKILADPDFKTRWEHFVRHMHYDYLKENALDNMDEYAWHESDDAQRINDVAAFAKAGRLNDLEAYADSLLRTSAEDVSELRQMFEDEGDTVLKNMSDDEVLDWVQKRAKDIKKEIRRYRDFHDSLELMALGTSDPEVLDELVFTRSQMMNFEDRYRSLLGEVSFQVRPYIENLAREKKANGEPTDRARKAQDLLVAEGDLSRLFGGIAADPSARASDPNSSPEANFAVFVDDMQQDRVLNALEDLGTFAETPELKNKVQDLQRLVRARQEYYSRLFDPTGRKKFVEEVKQDAKTDEGVGKQMKDEANEKQVGEYITKLSAAKNFKEFAMINRSLPPLSDPEANEALQQKIAEHPSLGKFVQTYADIAGFVDGIKKDVDAAQAANPSPETAAALSKVNNEIDKLDDAAIDDIIIKADESTDPIVAVAQSMLDGISADPKADNILRKMLTEKLGDVAKANNLGVISAPAVTPTPAPEPPVAPEATGQTPGENIPAVPPGAQPAPPAPPAPGSTGSSSGPSAVYTDAVQKVAAVTDRNDTMLQKLIDGDFSDFPGLLDSEKPALQLAALNQREALDSQLGLLPAASSGDYKEVEDSSTDPARQARRQEAMQKESTTFSASNPSVYNTRELPKGRKVYATSQDMRKDSQLRWLRERRAQEFVDSGALYILDAAYRARGKRLPVYFLANPHVSTKNPFALSIEKTDRDNDIASDLIFAIEMNDENRSILAPFKELFTDNSLLHIEGKDYQVIGKMWNPFPSDIDSKPEEFKSAYQNMKDEVAAVWDHVMTESILPRYREEQKQMDDEGKWYVGKVHPVSDTQQTDVHKADWSTGERLYTTVNYIGTGRMHTTNDGNDKYTKVNLRDSLANYRNVGGRYHFALVTGQGVQSPGDTGDLGISINAPAGSLWLSTSNANGSRGWTYVTTARTGEVDINDNQSVIMKDLRRAIDMLYDPNVGWDKRFAAIRQIKDTIYFGEGNEIDVEYVEGLSVITIGGAETTTREQFVEHLKNANYRFQVQLSDIYDSRRMDALIDAGILQSEIQDFIRIGATVGMNFLEDMDAEGNPVKPMPRESIDPVAWNPNDAVVFAPSSVTGTPNIRIGRNGYRLDDDGTVRRMTAGSRSGQVVVDKATVAQVKAIAELMTTQGANYPGKSWVIDRQVETVSKNGKRTQRNLQYTRLFEREIDGVTIRMEQRGRNGAYRIVFSNDEWNALMQAEGIKRVGQDSYRRTTSTETQLSDDNAERDAALAEEARQASAEETPATPKRKAGKRGRRTLQDLVQQEQQEEEEVDC